MSVKIMAICLQSDKKCFKDLGTNKECTRLFFQQERDVINDGEMKHLQIWMFDSDFYPTTNLKFTFRCKSRKCPIRQSDMSTLVDS